MEKFLKECDMKYNDVDSSKLDFFEVVEKIVSLINGVCQSDK